MTWHAFIAKVMDIPPGCAKDFEKSEVVAAMDGYLDSALEAITEAKYKEFLRTLRTTTFTDFTITEQEFARTVTFRRNIA